MQGHIYTGHDVHSWPWSWMQTRR